MLQVSLKPRMRVDLRLHLVLSALNHVASRPALKSWFSAVLQANRRSSPAAERRPATRAPGQLHREYRAAVRSKKIDKGWEKELEVDSASDDEDFEFDDEDEEIARSMKSFFLLGWIFSFWGLHLIDIGCA